MQMRAAKYHKRRGAVFAPATPLYSVIFRFNPFGPDKYAVGTPAIARRATAGRLHTRQRAQPAGCGGISLQTAACGNAQTVSKGFCPRTLMARRSPPSAQGAREGISEPGRRLGNEQKICAKPSAPEQ